MDLMILIRILILKLLLIVSCTPNYAWSQVLIADLSYGEESVSEIVYDVTYSEFRNPVVVGNVCPFGVYSGSCGDSAFISSIGLDGSILWRKYFSFGGGHLIRFNNILKLEEGYLVSGEAVVPNHFGLRAVLARMDNQGDTVWLRHYGLAGFSTLYTSRMMLDGNRVLICGGATEPSSSSYIHSGFVLETNIDGDSIDFKQYFPADSNSHFRFVNLENRADGSAKGLIGIEINSNTQTSDVLLSTFENNHIETEWSTEQEGFFRLDGQGGVSEGERSFSDTVTFYASDGSQPSLSGMVRYNVWPTGFTMVSIGDFLDYQVYQTHGTVRYGGIDLTLGIFIDSTNSPVQFIAASGRLDPYPFWKYVTSYPGLPFATGMTLDTVKGVLYVAGNVSDGTNVDGKVLVFDLTQLLKLLDVREDSFSSFIDVWPNPVSSLLHIKVADELERMNGLIRIVNSQGKEMTNFVLTSNNQTIDCVGWQDGVYTIIVIIRGENVVSKKFVKLK